jgi:hypothetical protein
VLSLICTTPIFRFFVGSFSRRTGQKPAVLLILEHLLTLLSPTGIAGCDTPAGKEILPDLSLFFLEFLLKKECCWQRPDTTTSDHFQILECELKKHWHATEKRLCEKVSSSGWHAGLLAKVVATGLESKASMAQFQDQ